MGETQMDMYIKNQAALLKKYSGKIIAVHNGNCLGVFPSKLSAYRAMREKGFLDGQYVIVECSPGDSAYTTFWANYIADVDSVCHS